LLLAAASRAVEPRARYLESVELGGYRLAPGACWSPVDHRLLLVRRGELAVFDARSPGEMPRRILEAQVLAACWSPDGAYVACRVRVPTAVRGGSVRLQFVSTAGGEAEYRLPRARIGAYLWTEDGVVWMWDAQSGKRHRIDPPRAWLEALPELPRHRAPHLVEVPDPEARRTRILAFVAPDSAGAPVETPLPALAPPHAFDVGLVDAFRVAHPDSARFLVKMRLPNEDLRTWVVDAHGEPLARLGDADSLPVFAGSSVSPDGRCVVGTRTREQDRVLLSSELWVADAGGRWCVLVEGAGNASAATFARHASAPTSAAGHATYFVAHEDPIATDDIVHVGHITVEMP
jgi:hypothetical protein